MPYIEKYEISCRDKIPLIILNQYIFGIGERVVDGIRKTNCLARKKETDLDSIIDKKTG